MFKQPLVLIVDDQPRVVLPLEYLLRSTGAIDVATATNGRDAVAAATERRPQLVLLDVVMPEMDGYEACREIRRVWGDEHAGQIWLVTARGMATDQDQTAAVGADRMITKPFDPDALLRMVEEVVFANPAPGQVS